ncbi:MAG: hypothetical protein ACKVOW_10535 [Chitinophagaceae bacterium]
MKKLLLVLAIGTFVACNSETAADAVKKADSTTEAIKAVDTSVKAAIDTAAAKIIDTLKK